MRIVLLPLLAFLGACSTIPAEQATTPLWGVQLYTVRDAMARDPFAAISQVAELGYDEIEFAGTHGADPTALCRHARQTGLEIAAAHADWALLKSDPDAAIAEAKALCADTLVLAWLPPEERQTLDQWRGWIATLNRVNAKAEAEGLALGYHAHDFEFAALDGVRPIDLLMRDLDPDIGFELDTYWVAKAGGDPLAFLRRHAGRVTHLHLKDMAADGSMADIGKGTLPMAEIVAQARAQGVRHFIVERDDAPDPWASLAASLDSLRAMPLQRGTHSTASGSAPQ